MTRVNSAPGASNAFAWSLLNTVVSKVGTLGIGIVLARMLGPESFGTYAVALVALMAVLSFNELGVSLAIVRWPGDPAAIVPTVNTISVAGSFLFCTGAMLAAPAFTAAMGDPGATDVVRILILSVFINGVVASPAALLQRDFKEKTRLGIDQVNVWTGAVLSIVLALTGMGAMALAVGRVAGSLVSGAMFLAASPMPYRFGLDRSQLGPLLRFGLPLAGTSIIFFAVGYADQLTAGAMLGPAALGLLRPRVQSFQLARQHPGPATPPGCARRVFGTPAGQSSHELGAGLRGGGPRRGNPAACDVPGRKRGSAGGPCLRERVAARGCGALLAGGGRCQPDLLGPGL